MIYAISKKTRLVKQIWSLGPETMQMNQIFQGSGDRIWTVSLELHDLVYPADTSIMIWLENEIDVRLS